MLVVAAGIAIVLLGAIFFKLRAETNTTQEEVFEHANDLDTEMVLDLLSWEMDEELEYRVEGTALQAARRNRLRMVLEATDAMEKVVAGFRDFSRKNKTSLRRKPAREYTPADKLMIELHERSIHCRRLLTLGQWRVRTLLVCDIVASSVDESTWHVLLEFYRNHVLDEYRLLVSCAREWERSLMTA